MPLMFLPFLVEIKEPQSTYNEAWDVYGVASGPYLTYLRKPPTAQRRRYLTYPDTLGSPNSHMVDQTATYLALIPLTLLRDGGR